MMHNYPVEWMSGRTIGGMWGWIAVGAVVVVFVVIAFNQFFKK